jgi:hypothetical protein
VLLNSFDLIIEVLIPEFFKLSGLQVVFQETDDQILERAEIEQKVADCGWPIQPSRKYCGDFLG